MALKRSEVKRPVRRKETIDVPELGGEVIIHALPLSGRFEVLYGELPKSKVPSELLARTVMDNEGEPIYTFQEWEDFGADYEDAVFRIIAVVKRISNLGESEKKE